jgi:hypothetical protein
MPGRAKCIILSIIFAIGATGPTLATSRAYYCFFDRGSARITDRCKQVVLDMAHAWRVLHKGSATGQSAMPDASGPKSVRVPELRIAVHAFAPDATVPEIATRLSLLRALAVAAELRTAGVPDESITPVGFGSDIPPYGGFPPGEPLDPQNRVGIMILN